MNRCSKFLRHACSGFLGLLSMGAVLASTVQGCTSEIAASPCETTFAAECGKSCLDDNGCAAGLHCSAGACTAECTEGGSECQAGITCSPRGRCGDDLGGSGFGDPGGPGDHCPSVNVTFGQVTPTVMLLIDQSGSMNDNFGGDGSRWNVLYDALMNTQNGVVSTLSDEIRFGLALYTSRDGFQGGTCPMITQVDAALGNYESIRQRYQNARPDDETPTGESIDKIVDYLKTVDEAGPRMILLATDGMPDTCAVPNPQNGEPEAIAAARRAHGEGIKTVVLSVGPDVALNHLQDMANAGAGIQNGQASAPYYQALNQTSLIDAFKQIIGGVRACVFTLDGVVTTDDPAQGEVLLDGERLTYNDPDGWRLNNASELELVGNACRRVQEDAQSIKITFPCGTVEVIQ
ncbi:vWA domain-containing protein [Chondromyces crocatus]|uniref:VWFA domain-containing protein n=1 Tax=Chondromyces crocatus TaxID=52 RepID=A0A0K1EB25_CHOCO|nr:vWA domain-containing protein [Chondromyces crocatus]AKT37783.1 uncharacterized protein CMC5_019250 [Chondromyces crocatus]